MATLTASRMEDYLREQGIGTAWEIYQALTDPAAACRLAGLEPTHLGILADWLEETGAAPEAVRLYRVLSLPEDRRDRTAETTLVDIVSKLGRYGSLTARQQSFLTALARRVLERPVQDAGKETVPVGDMAGVVALLKTAGEHLQYPKIRVAVINADGTLGEQYRLFVAGPRSKHPGWIGVTEERKSAEDERRPWVGWIDAEGRFGHNAAKHPGLADVLRRLAADPAGVAQEYGRLLGNCCFCGLPLSDERSTAVGYGATCASHYHLPWGEKAAKPAPAIPQAPEPAPAPQAAPAAPPANVTVAEAVPTLRTDHAFLHYDGKTKTFTAEISDLHLPGWPRRLRLVSHKTGDVREFVLAQRETDAEGDLRWVDYDGADGLCMRIFND